MRTKTKLNFIDIEGNGVHIFVDAKINGENVNLLIDTGASKSVFDKNSVEQLFENHEINKTKELSIGLGTDSMESMITVFEELKIADLKIENYETVILDLSHINASYQALNLPEIFGVIGGDFLSNYNAIINYKTKTLRIDS